MAETTTIHAQLIRYSTDGNQIIVNLKNTAADVSIDVSKNTKVPAKATDLQSLVGVLGKLAFADTIADASTSASGLMTAAMVTKLNGIAAGANAYSHPNSGVTAGTYKSVTVNAQGHVTAGSNPTTLAGYGITDAVSSSDSRLTNSRPASDVYAWAKATSKPSYSKSEVGLGNVDNTADSAKSVKYATSAGSAGSASQFSFTELSDTDLNTLTTEGKIYFSGGSNTCKNGPVTAGTVRFLKSAGVLSHTS